MFRIILIIIGGLVSCATPKDDPANKEIAIKLAARFYLHIAKGQYLKNTNYFEGELSRGEGDRRLKNVQSRVGNLLDFKIKSKKIKIKSSGDQIISVDYTLSCDAIYEKDSLKEQLQIHRKGNDFKIVDYNVYSKTDPNAGAWW
jgi:hypothetical protein